MGRPFRSPRRAAGPGPRRGGSGRRTGFLVFVGVLALLIAWQILPDRSGPGTARPAGGAEGSPSPTPERSRPGELPPPEEIPIEHIVFMIKENRTFDHYFGRYPGAEGATEGGTLR
ncbi:MAG TPA: alkaline phosphatase family protein, partial [Actinomycetota bacterium]|nr:alkaline phosphatase family protein [Actinomycetota bacterium]